MGFWLVGLAGCAVEPTYTLPLEMVRIEPGVFQMGSPPGEAGRDDNEGPVEITLTRPFLLMTHEVTQSQYAEVMGTNPAESRRSEPGPNDATISLEGPSLPVVQVTWYDAIAFANAVSAREGLAPAYVVAADGSVTWDPTSPGYRLPTEAEWEYAARAGGTGPYGDPTVGVADLCRVANVGDESDRAYFARTYETAPCDDGYPYLAPVKQFPPNAWGLYDLLGNASEWVFDATRKELVAGTDPVGRRSGRVFSRMTRGFGVGSGPSEVRVAFRLSLSAAELRTDGTSFRLARSIDPPPSVGPIEIAGGGAPTGPPEMARIPGSDRVSEFWLMTREVDQATWESVMGDNPAEAVAAAWPRKEGGGAPPVLVGPDLPVVGVSWERAVAFANALSVRDGYQVAYRTETEKRPSWHGNDHPPRWLAVRWDGFADGYRLPTEAEWEHAASGGLSGVNLGPWGQVWDEAALCTVANIDDASYDALWAQSKPDGCNDGQSGTSRAGTFPPNPFGLYDMFGNASEWVYDAWSYGDRTDAMDARGQPLGASRVSKGGSWSGEQELRKRSWFDASESTPGSGLRLARSIPRVQPFGAGSDGLLDVVRIEAGSFRMGAKGDRVDGPVDVTLSRPFAMMARELTVARYREVLGTSLPDAPGDQPITGLTVAEIATFANALSLRDGLQAAYWIHEDTAAYHPGTTGWRLPTEAEWEYAARAGAVGLAPNAWGLFDMTGSACELVNDEFGALPGGLDPYVGSGSARICRGGRLDGSVESASLTSRQTVTGVSSAVGYRLVRTLAE